jgi:hypothetical protein
MIELSHLIASSCFKDILYALPSSLINCKSALAYLVVSLCDTSFTSIILGKVNVLFSATTSISVG